MGLASYREDLIGRSSSGYASFYPFPSRNLVVHLLYQDTEGKMRDTWPITAIRVTDLAVTPDLSRLVAVGMQHLQPVPAVIDLSPPRDHNGDAAPTPAPVGSSLSASGARASEHRMIIYDLATKETQSYVHFVFSCLGHFIRHSFSHRSMRLEGELTSVKVSRDSQYALINHAPDVRGFFAACSVLFMKLFFTGGSLVGSQCWPTGAQVHWTATRSSCHPKLLRRH